MKKVLCIDDERLNLTEDCWYEVIDEYKYEYCVCDDEGEPVIISKSRFKENVEAEWEEDDMVIKSAMDLRYQHIVEFRNGEVGIVTGDTIRRPCKQDIHLSDYNKFSHYMQDHRFDIVKVYDTENYEGINVLISEILFDGKATIDKHIETLYVENESYMWEHIDINTRSVYIYVFPHI